MTQTDISTMNQMAHESGVDKDFKKAYWNPYDSIWKFHRYCFNIWNFRKNADDSMVTRDVYMVGIQTEKEKVIEKAKKENFYTETFEKKLDATVEELEERYNEIAKRLRW